jgi:hypothetical protein
MFDLNAIWPIFFGVSFPEFFNSILEICTAAAMPAAGGTAGGRQRAARRHLTQSDR